jgi:hypothetical protein
MLDIVKEKTAALCCVQDDRMYDRTGEDSLGLQMEAMPKVCYQIQQQNRSSQHEPVGSEKGKSLLQPLAQEEPAKEGKDRRC